MADDHPQRPFRNTDLPSRATPTASNPSSGSNDPLAELARLIGQSDPFGEFGRDAARQPSALPSATEPEPMLRALAAQAAQHEPYPAQTPAAPPSADDFARQPFGSAPLTGGDDLYQTQGSVPGYEGYDDQAGGLGGYQEAGYDPNMPPPYAGDEHDFYDDIPPPRRRMGVLAIAAVFALAVVGTAGAFGYRALFGSSGSGPPPVIKADTTPSKVIPDKDKDQSAKLINDRVNDPNAGQKLVSREEQPVDLSKGKPAGVLTQGQSVASAGGMQAPALGSGVIGPDPKKIHTITIRPDQPVQPDAGVAAPPQANVADAMPTQPADQGSMAASHEAAAPAARPAPAPRPTVTHRAAPAPHRVASGTPRSNAPLSLTPDAVAPPRSAPAPARTASAPTRLAPAASTAAASGAYAVQVSSRRSEADAQAALRRMQSRFSSVIGGQQVMVKRVDLGAKGVYYRAMVGPFGSSDEASRLCGRLKAAGGSCFVQKI